MSRNVFQKSTTTPQLVQQIYSKSAANLRQICNKSFSRTANPQQIDLLWILTYKFFFQFLA